MEFIYVVKREAVAPLVVEKGLTALEPEKLGGALEKGFFLERSYAEEDPAFKQIIPYVVIKRGKELFLFKRLKGGGEARLHNLYSIGVGGHINPTEGHRGRSMEIVLGGARRELSEEVGYEGDAPLLPLGLLNDDTNEVGAVHTGVVLLLDLSEGTSLTSREEEVLEGAFTPLSQVKALTGTASFETWSEIILAHDAFKALW